MRKECDLTKLAWRRNPYARRLKKIVTILLDQDVIEYFKLQATDLGVPYQRLINLYLRECARTKRKPELRWSRAS